MIYDIQRYAPVSCGVAANKKGDLLRVDDVARIIDEILDDDQMVAVELSRFVGYLRNRGET